MVIGTNKGRADRRIKRRRSRVSKGGSATNPNLRRGGQLVGREGSSGFSPAQEEAIRKQVAVDQFNALANKFEKQGRADIAQALRSKSATVSRIGFTQGFKAFDEAFEIKAALSKSIRSTQLQNLQKQKARSLAGKELNKTLRQLNAKPKMSQRVKARDNIVKQVLNQQKATGKQILSFGREIKEATKKEVKQFKEKGGVKGFLSRSQSLAVNYVKGIRPLAKVDIEAIKRTPDVVKTIAALKRVQIEAVKVQNGKKPTDKDTKRIISDLKLIKSTQPKIKQTTTNLKTFVESEQGKAIEKVSNAYIKANSLLALGAVGGATISALSKVAPLLTKIGSTVLTSSFVISTLNEARKKGIISTGIKAAIAVTLVGIGARSSLGRTGKAPKGKKITKTEALKSIRNVRKSKLSPRKKSQLTKLIKNAFNKQKLKTKITQRDISKIKGLKKEIKLVKQGKIKKAASQKVKRNVDDLVKSTNTQIKNIKTKLKSKKLKLKTKTKTKINKELFRLKDYVRRLKRLPKSQSLKVRRRFNKIKLDIKVKNFKINKLLKSLPAKVKAKIIKKKITITKGTQNKISSLIKKTKFKAKNIANRIRKIKSPKIKKAIKAKLVKKLKKDLFKLEDSVRRIKTQEQLLKKSLKSKRSKSLNKILQNAKKTIITSERIKSSGKALTATQSKSLKSAKFQKARIKTEKFRIERRLEVGLERKGRLPKSFKKLTKTQRIKIIKNLRLDAKRAKAFKKLPIKQSKELKKINLKLLQLRKAGINKPQSKKSLDIIAKQLSSSKNPNVRKSASQLKKVNQNIRKIESTSGKQRLELIQKTKPEIKKLTSNIKKELIPIKSKIRSFTKILAKTPITSTPPPKVNLNLRALFQATTLLGLIRGVNLVMAQRIQAPSLKKDLFKLEDSVRRIKTQEQKLDKIVEVTNIPKLTTIITTILAPIAVPIGSGLLLQRFLPFGAVPFGSPTQTPKKFGFPKGRLPIKSNFIFISDLAARIRGEKATKKEAKELLQVGRIFTGLEARKRVR